MVYVDNCSLKFAVGPNFNTNWCEESRWAMVINSHFSQKSSDNLLQSSHGYAILARSVQQSGVHNVVINVSVLLRRGVVSKRRRQSCQKRWLVMGLAELVNAWLLKN